jgi:hypothetical protein
MFDDVNELVKIIRDAKLNNIKELNLIHKRNNLCDIIYNLIEYNAYEPKIQRHNNSICNIKCQFDSVILNIRCQELLGEFLEDNLNIHE